MNRIDQIFTDLRSSGRRALMPFLTAGDPDLPTTAQLLLAMQDAGASICEIGIPFSDPIADGPVIQASMTHALDQGIRVEQVFDTVRAVRDQLTIGLVPMVSYSIVHRLGLDNFIQQAADAGFDGFIFPDLPLEEAEPAIKATKDAGLILSMLIAPTTPIERAQAIAKASTGFLYVVARSGITGESDQLPPELDDRLTALRQVTDVPIAVGFGISKPDHVASVVAKAEAAIVGSALVRRIAEHRDQPDAALNAATDFAQQLIQGLPADVSPEA